MLLGGVFCPREIVAYELAAESEAMFAGETEVDESYFGGKRNSDPSSPLMQLRQRVKQHLK